MSSSLKCILTQARNTEDTLGRWQANSNDARRGISSAKDHHSGSPLTTTRGGLASSLKGKLAGPGVLGAGEMLADGHDEDVTKGVTIYGHLADCGHCFSTRIAANGSLAKLNQVARLLPTGGKVIAPNRKRERQESDSLLAGRRCGEDQEI